LSPSHDDFCGAVVRVGSVGGPSVLDASRAHPCHERLLNLVNGLSANGRDPLATLSQVQLRSESIGHIDERSTEPCATRVSRI